MNNELGKTDRGGGQKPQNLGEMEDADAIGTVGSADCGDMLRMWIKFKEEDGRKVIDRATFQTFGCETAIAVASVATEMLAGKTVDEAISMTGEDLAAPLGALPPIKIHCAQLVEGALRAALGKQRRRSPPRPRKSPTLWINSRQAGAQTENRPRSLPNKLPMHENTEFTTARDVEAIQIPSGNKTTIPAGTPGVVTQTLGGSYTIATYQGLARIAEKDLDALGLEKPTRANGREAFFRSRRSRSMKKLSGINYDSATIRKFRSTSSTLAWSTIASLSKSRTAARKSK